MSVSVCSYLVIPVDNIFHHSFIPLIQTFGVCGLLTKQPPDCSSSRQWDPSHCHHCLLYSGHCPAETPSPSPPTPSPAALPAHTVGLSGHRPSPSESGPVVPTPTPTHCHFGVTVPPVCSQSRTVQLHQPASQPHGLVTRPLRVLMRIKHSM